MQALLRCTITPGQFSSEYTVIGKQSDGGLFSFFIPQDYVECDHPPTQGASVEGWVRVQIWQDYGNRAVVRLPRESFERGQYVTVPKSELQINPKSQAVP